LWSTYFRDGQNKLLEIINSILDRKGLSKITKDQNVYEAGLTSIDLLELVLKLEKLHYKVVGTNTKAITTIENLYKEIQI
jgi:acyl carrier protein